MKKSKNRNKITDGQTTLYNRIPNYFIPTGETGTPQQAVGSDELLSNAVQAEGVVPVSPSVPMPYENIDAEIAKRQNKNK